MKKIKHQKLGKVAHLVLGGSTVDELTVYDIKQLVNFYRQRASDLEFSNLQWQLKYNKLVAMTSQPIPATKITKSKSE